MIVYKMNRTIVGESCSYGIDVCYDEKTIKSIPELSESRSEISELVEMCNSLEVEACQIDDIVDDYLTDFRL